ncbi:glucosamine-6-phosphate deaminase [Homoserinibacter sp. YIM 151385]|uniref:glucosamine-6-phosphate deaminase n=1 Tax=Homoserinibacter sp. YIM 151385 TaxID=2985506 RepID=UPI0022F04C14|nr:glucosamine-6-phosphate deaminase [Homoserinibacter sp. YIM 151385]WBU36769.1 glucosamine-6-phosphate deaminase [Homoserinibacter sp. YIM 151385]
MAEVVIVRDAEEGGALAASLIASLVRRKPEAVLGLATGSTPLTTWRSLAGAGLDLSRVSGFALDEYLGLPDGHPESYQAVVVREIVEVLGLDPARVRVPGDDGGPLEEAGVRYEAAIREAGGIDLQVLGIGRTAHIGFNEPGSSLASRTRIKTLAEQTRLDNARFFDSVDEVPRHCLTQGLGTILDARHAVLLAWGEAKAEAVAAALEGPVTASVPGSALQLHPEVTAIVDEAAASRLANAAYYRFAWEHRDAVGG